VKKSVRQLTKIIKVAKQLKNMGRTRLAGIAAEPKNGTGKRGWRNIVGRERKEEGET